MSHDDRPPRFAWRTRAQRRREAELEIETHLRMRTEDLILQGVPPEEARAQAIARFGELERAQEQIEAAARQRDRRLQWTEWLESLRRDLVVAGRRIRSKPGQALLYVLIFGFGIGLTTAMYSVVDRVLLRALPFPESDRLVALHSVPEDGASFPWVSMGNWFDWHENNRTLEATALYDYDVRDATVSAGDAAFRAPAVSVFGEFFEALRLPFVAGSAPGEATVQNGAELAVVSEGFWQRVLGGVPPGDRRLVVDGRARQIVGVVRAGFEYPEGTEIWVPLPYRSQTGGMRNNINFRALARLAPGVTPDRAESDLSAIADEIRTRDPEGIYSWGVGVQPLHQTVVGSSSDYLVMLMGAVLLVLLIACANLAALGFARGTERAAEVATRLSIGAGRRRIVRQLLTEDLVLAGLGGLLGIALAWVITQSLLHPVSEVVPRLSEGGFDVRVLAAGVLVSLAAGIAAGLPPALGAARRGVGRVLAAARPVVGGRSLPGALLVGAEVALTVLLLTASGLLLMSLRAVTSRDLGFDPQSVMTADVVLASVRYSDANERVLDYWDAVRRELEASPETEVVGFSNWVPTSEGGRGFIELADRPDTGIGADYRIVSESYFEALGIPLLRGRAISRSDRLGTEPVVVINQAMAEEYWPGRDPIGQRVRATSMEAFWHDGEAPWRTVVGVVGDIRHYGFESDSESEMYVAHRQMPWMARAMTAVVRVRTGQMAAAMRAARPRIQALDPSLAVDLSTLEDRLRIGLGERRLIAGLLAAFALVALGLAALGVYGVFSLAVQKRTREVAIRSALGAPRNRVVRLVLGGAFRVILAGAAVGICLALAARSLLDSLLLDISPVHPLAYLGAGACLLAVALVAAVVPARRASRLDPVRVLRQP